MKDKEAREQLYVVIIGPSTLITKSLDSFRHQGWMKEWLTVLTSAQETKDTQTN